VEKGRLAGLIGWIKSVVGGDDSRDLLQSGLCLVIGEGELSKTEHKLPVALEEVYIGEEADALVLQGEAVAGFGILVGGEEGRVDLGPLAFEEGEVAPGGEDLGLGGREDVFVEDSGGLLEGVSGLYLALVAVPEGEGQADPETKLTYPIAAQPVVVGHKGYVGIGIGLLEAEVGFVVGELVG
jgi:hypothetical protein